MFKSWCKSQGFCNASNLSHVLMDGGVLSVPYDRLNDFYETCITSIHNGEKIFVVEQKTDIYNFFVDLDFKVENELSLEYMTGICKNICKCVKSLGGGDAVVSLAKPKPYKNMLKHGIHINWNNFPVNRESAIALRKHIIKKLETKEKSKNWQDIVDSSVYGNVERDTKGSGFRMPWCHKKSKHEKCAGTGCSECDKGKLTEGVYLPLYMYKSGSVFGDILEQIDPSPTLELFWMTTVRSNSKDYKLIDCEFEFPKLTKTIEYDNDDVRIHLQCFIRKHMDGQNNAEITKIHEHENRFLVSTTSKYCENLKRCHSSNHVWFYIENEFISQKCFCKCETTVGRNYGFCKDFKGRTHKLPDKVVDELYKNKQKVKITRSKSPPKKENNDIKIELLNNFISKYILKNQSANISKIVKKQAKKSYTLETTFSCDVCDKNNITFTINKYELCQICSCKNPRKHRILDKIYDVL